MNYPNYFVIGDDKSTTLPEEYWLLPAFLYLVEKRIYLSQESVRDCETNNAPSVISERFSKGNFPAWKKISLKYENFLKII